MSNRRKIKPPRPRLPVAAVRRAVEAAAVSAVAKGIGPGTRYCVHLAGKATPDCVLIMAEDNPDVVTHIACPACAKAGGAKFVIHLDGRST